MRSTKEGKLRRRDKCVKQRGHISKQKLIDAESTQKHAKLKLAW